MAKVQDQSKLVSSMLKRSQSIRDIIAGGSNMRTRAETYLPKFTLESAEDYKARLKSTWLFNGVKKARNDMAARVFEKPMVLASQEGQLFDWCQNIDLEGRDLSNFAYDVFTSAIEDGVSFIMVDAPLRTQQVTRGQAQALNLRPYFSLVRLVDVLGWKWENIGNAPVLTQWRVMEEVADPTRDEFDDSTIKQIRVLDLQEGRVRVRLYRKPDDRRSANEFVLFDEYQTEMTQIQVSPVYTGRTGFMEASPPLADIAELNLAHWRTQSDKSNCLHKALSPLLLIRGIEMEGDAIASAGYAFTSSNESAALEWAEITGSGIKAGTEELRDLERQMEWMGLQLIREQTGSSTATGDNIREGKSVSHLRAWADNLKDAVEIALDWMADMGGISADTDVVVHKDFTVGADKTMPEVREMYLAGVITGEDYIKEAKRRGIAREDQGEELPELDFAAQSVV